MPGKPKVPRSRVPSSISEYKMKKLIAQAHDNAVDKGFWDAVDDIGMATADPDALLVAQKVALIHSEASEIVNAIKDEQVEEAADVAIRVFDLAGYLGLPLRYFTVVWESQVDITDDPDVWETAASIHYRLGLFTQDHRKGEDKRLLEAHLSSVVKLCRWLAERRGAMFWEEVEAKMKHNETRERKHGARY